MNHLWTIIDNRASIKDKLSEWDNTLSLKDNKKSF